MDGVSPSRWHWTFPLLHGKSWIILIQTSSSTCTNPTSRVVSRHGFISSLSSFALDVRAAILGDCLYRFKNHATWILPSIDIDEYINMKDGSVFEGVKVPEDYLDSEKTGAPTQHSSLNGVQHLSFCASSTQLEFLSVLHEPRVQPLCPKFVVNPNWCHAIFVRCTSWKNGTQNLGLSPDTLVAHHFRLRHDYAIAGYIETNATDTSIQQYVPGLSTSLAARFHEETMHFLRRLSSVEAAPMKPSILYDVDSPDTEEELQAAQDPTTAAWIRSLSNLKGIVIVDPPSEHALHSRFCSDDVLFNTDPAKFSKEKTCFSAAAIFKKQAWTVTHFL